MSVRAAVITVSDKGYAGLREDRSGPLLASALVAHGFDVVERVVVPDEAERIAAELVRLVDVARVDLVMTTGGTGLAPRDHTPEATLSVIDRQVWGIAELIRSEGAKKTPLAALSRGVAGLRGACLVINLPGSPRAVTEGMEILATVLGHALQMAQGRDLEHREAPGG